MLRVEPHVLQMLDPTLDDERQPVSTNMIRGLLANAILCAHDRRVTIEWMIDFLNLTSDCHLLLSNMDSALRMKQVLATVDPDRTPARILEEIQGIETSIDRVRAVMHEKFKLLPECSRPGEPIN